MQTKNKLLVFPTSRSIREYVNSQREFNSLLPSIITIDEFFKKSLFFKNKKYIDEDERVLYLKEAVKSVDLKKLGINSSFSYFIKQSDYIYRFFLELASENIEIDSIDSADTYGFYSEHLSILKEIQKNFLRLLDENDFVDRVNFSKYYEINNEFIKRYSQIELNFEGYFTSFEFEIIKKIAETIKLDIRFTFNEYNEKSIERFIRYGFNLDLGYNYLIDFSNLKVLEKNEIEVKSDYVEIKGFASRINQIAFIKKSVVDLVNKGIEPSKIALILPDEKFASSVSLFDKERYFNYAMGLNIYTTNLFRVADAIYAYMNEDEIKNKENISFLGLDFNVVKNLFEDNWNRQLSLSLFENIIEFFISQETKKELLEKFNEMVYKLYKVIFSYGENIKLKDAYKIFFQKISQITLDDVNSGKITVMGLLESRCLDFDAIMICDFNESLIPKRNVKDKFLSTKIKQNSNLPTSIDRENLQKYYYQKLINSTKQLYISYVKNDSDQITRFANSLFSFEIDEKLYDNNYKHILYNNKDLTHFDEDVILDIDLSKLIWSASSLKEFLECKRKYYLNHILKIKEHTISLKPKGYELGNIVHETLEEYYKQDNYKFDLLIDIFNKKRTKNSFLNLELEVWKKKLEEFVYLEKQRFDQGYIIKELEKPFLFDYNGIKLRGTIDRIDKKDDNYFVIDYKTSSNLKIDTKRSLEKAKDFQLEFYFLAVNELYKTDNINTMYYDLYNMQLVDEAMLNEKLVILEELLKTFNTKTVSFEKCEERSTCSFCIYKTICNR